MYSLTMSDRSRDNITLCAEEVYGGKGVHSPQSTNVAFQLRNQMAQKRLRRPAKLLLLARLINRQDVVFRGFGRRCP